MKSITTSLAALLFLTLAIAFANHTAEAQPVSGSLPNQVLELDGDGGYVELPPDILNDLDEATVEVWVRWDSFGSSTDVLYDASAFSLAETRNKI